MATHEAASAAGAERRVLRASSELPLIDLAEVRPTSCVSHTYGRLG
jgi:hypothetical protein